MNEQLLANLLAEFTGMFFRGEKSKYVAATTHKDKLYFATDTHELLVNGVSYGGGGITEVTLEGTTLKISLSDGTEKTVDLASLLKFTTQLPDDLATPTKIGGLNKGTTVETLKTKTLSQIFEDILFEEIQPTVQNPSCSISPKGSWSNNGIYEVGAAAPGSESDFNISFNRGNCTVVGQPTKYRAGTETSRDVKLGSEALAAGAKITLGTMTYNLTINHGEGDTLLTSKGNKATISPNPLTAGSVKASCSIYGTYPYFCNGASASTGTQDSNLPSSVTPNTKLPLQKWTDTLIGAKFASEALTGTRLEFIYPKAKNVTKVEFYDTASKEWKIFGTDKYTTSATDQQTVQGVKVDYMKLTTTGDKLGALQFRFTVSNASTYADEPRTFSALSLMSEGITPMAAATGNRPSGVATYAANFEPTGQVPLDARTVVPTKADLIASATYSSKNYYKGMTVTVLDDGGKPAIYILQDPTKITELDYSGWVKAGGNAEESGIGGVYVLPGCVFGLETDTSLEDVKAAYGSVSELKKALANNNIIISKFPDNDSPYIIISGCISSEGIASFTFRVDNVIYTQNPIIDGEEITGFYAIKNELVTGVQPGDKVLKTSSQGKISATLGLNYDSISKKIQLQGIESEIISEIDATAFIKDGMINAVELVNDPEDQDPGTYIKITFNTDAGKEPIFLNVTSLIDIYVQGNGISISGKTISVKLDTAGNTEGYLQLGTAGLKVAGINDAISTAITTAFSWHDA